MDERPTAARHTMKMVLENRTLQYVYCIFKCTYSSGNQNK